MPRVRKLGTFILILWAASLAFSSGLYLTCLQPARLTAILNSFLENNPLGTFTAESCSVKLLPVPSVSLEQLAFRGDSIKNFTFQSSRVTVGLSWGSILRLRPIVRSILLEDPVCTMDRFSPDTFSSLQAAHRSDSAVMPLADPLGPKIKIFNGAAALRTVSGDVFSLHGIKADIHFPALLSGGLTLGIREARYATPGGLDVSGPVDLHVADLRRRRGEWTGSLSASTNLQMQPLDTLLGHTIEKAFRYFPMPKPAALSAKARLRFSSLSDYQAGGTLAADAVLPMNGHDVPIALSLPFECSSSSPDIRIAAAKLRMEDDSAELNGTVKTDEAGMPVFTGDAKINHFSLIRWFWFGREMDPGLQKSLDNITGTFEGMTLSPAGVYVPTLKAQVCGMHFTGSGGCKKYTEPFIAIDIHTQHAELNKIFTELRGHIPDMSHLPPPVLPETGSSGEDGKDPRSRVGFDIHVSSDRTSVLDLDTGGADVHVLPADPGVLLDIAIKDFYAGNVTSKVYLRDRVSISSALKNVSLKPLSQAFAGYDAASGKLDIGDLGVSFEPGNGLHMLHTLKVSGSGTIKKGYFKNKRSGMQAFNSVKFTVNSRAASKEQKKLPPRMNFAGKWDVSMDSGAFSVRALSDNAALTFSTANWLPESMTRQSAVVDLTLKKQKDAFKNLRFSGTASFSTANKTLELFNTSVANDFFSARGSAVIKNQASSYQISGKADAKTASLRRLLSSAGFDNTAVRTARALDSASLHANFRASPGQLTLEDISAAIGDSRITGQLACSLKDLVSCRGSLHCSSLDLARYLPETSQKKGRTPFPVEAMSAANFDLRLSFGRLRAWSTTLADANIDISLKGGKFVAPFKARFPGGGTLDGKMAASPIDAAQADLYLHAKASGVNMLNLTRDRKQSTLISGTGAASAVLNSRQAYWSDWSKKLNGSMMLAITKGFIRSNDSKGSSETPFNKLSMTAAAHNGVLRCNDFILQGTLTDIEGSGTIDLDTLKINADADITLAGIPEMPVKITGTVLEPETNYKVLGAITGTAGNIGFSVFNLLGGIISAPFKLLSGNK